MLEETSTNIYENLDGKQAAMTESMSKSNERALATCITLGFDTNQEEVGKIETKKIDEDSVNVSLHKESRARAVKRVKPIGMTIDKEEADEKEFTKTVRSILHRHSPKVGHFGRHTSSIITH